MPKPKTLRFSHVGLFVMDLEKMVDFYSRVLGFTITDRGKLPTGEIAFLSRDPKEHHQIALVTGRPEGLPNLIVNQISFRLDSLEELQEFYRTLDKDEVSDIHPINHGVAWALYFRDPEGNRLELFVDTDCYIHQPCRDPLDLNRPADVIRAETKASCKTQPGYKPLEA